MITNIRTQLFQIKNKEHVLEEFIKRTGAGLENITPKALDPVVVHRLSGNDTSATRTSRLHHVVCHSDVFTASVNPDKNE